MKCEHHYIYITVKHHFFVIVLFCMYLALKIHSSETTKKLLDGLGGYHTEDRGLIDMKVVHITM